MMLDNNQRPYHRSMAKTIIGSMANTIITAGAHYNGDDDHYSHWYWYLTIMCQ